MSEIIKIEHLKKNFGKNEVLRDIDLSVDKGEVVTIIGSSGSGKSTLLRCINLLEKPSGGSCIGEKVFWIPIMIFPHTVHTWGWCFSSLTFLVT